LALTGCAALESLTDRLQPAAEEAVIVAAGEAANQGVVELTGGEADWMSPLVKGLLAGAGVLLLGGAGAKVLKKKETEA